MIVQAIRSAVFYVLFLGQTIILALFLGTATLFLPKGQRAPDWVWAVGRYWGHSNTAFLRYVVGIRTDVQGAENIPSGG
jgi:1-acyl-sn-glycerol-3-phosphate acyltransferase